MLIWPEYITLEKWIGNLQETYPNEFLPILQNREKWQEWATIAVSSGVFTQVGVPLPQGQKSWQEWAKLFYRTMIVQPNFGIR